MKKSILFLVFVFTSLISLAQTKANDSITLKDISYGDDKQQRIDIYLPKNRDINTKVFLLLHGGAWSRGSKEEFTFMAAYIKEAFPDCAVVNINYRLATPQSPAFPKQIDDITAVVSFLKSKSADYKISNSYAMLGVSAGAHLALLYSYVYDKNHDVKAVCSIVGPTDFTDKMYTTFAPFSQGMLQNLVGKSNTYESNPEIFKEVSPALRVSIFSPKTIMFHGANDLLVPRTQGNRLKDALDGYTIYNELYIYEGEKHGGWNDEHDKDMKAKMKAFFSANF